MIDITKSFPARSMNWLDQLPQLSASRKPRRLLAALALGLAAPAMAKPVTDCPLRDAPFSVDAPLIDVLASPTAKAEIERTAPGKLAKVDGFFGGAMPPGFGAIMSLRFASQFSGMTPAELAATDKALRVVAVTPQDKVARCARYDNDAQVFALPKDKPSLLLFEKITGFKDAPSVNAAHAAFVAMAERKGYHIVTTDKAGAFVSGTLKKFKAVIWNNISGDALTLSQRAAFQSYLEKGGGFIGVHGTGGDLVYFWPWYTDKLLGALFIGHPMNPQFQDARVVIDDPAHPAAKDLPREWRMTDEWYSFKLSPRFTGARVIATLDEKSYSPVGFGGQNLRMGDHAIAWSRCVGQGRMFYSAIGHRPETYSDPNYVRMLENAIDYASQPAKECLPPPPKKR